MHHSKKADIVLVELAQYVVFLVVLLGFIYTGSKIYASTQVTNPDAMTTSQFLRLVNDIDNRSIHTSPFIIDKEQYFLKVQNLEDAKDRDIFNNKKYDDKLKYVEICLMRETKKISCQVIKGLVVNDQPPIKFSGSFNIIITIDENELLLQNSDDLPTIKE